MSRKGRKGDTHSDHGSLRNQQPPQELHLAEPFCLGVRLGGCRLRNLFARPVVPAFEAPDRRHSPKPRRRTPSRRGRRLLSPPEERRAHSQHEPLVASRSWPPHEFRIPHSRDSEAQRGPGVRARESCATNATTASRREDDRAKAPCQRRRPPGRLGAARWCVGSEAQGDPMLALFPDLRTCE